MKHLVLCVLGLTLVSFNVRADGNSERSDYIRSRQIEVRCLSVINFAEHSINAAPEEKHNLYKQVVRNLKEIRNLINHSNPFSTLTVRSTLSWALDRGEPVIASAFARYLVPALITSEDADGLRRLARVLSDSVLPADHIIVVMGDTITKSLELAAVLSEISYSKAVAPEQALKQALIRLVENKFNESDLMVFYDTLMRLRSPDFKKDLSPETEKQILELTSPLIRAIPALEKLADTTPAVASGENE